MKTDGAVKPFLGNLQKSRNFIEEKHLFIIYLTIPQIINAAYATLKSLKSVSLDKFCIFYALIVTISILNIETVIYVRKRDFDGHFFKILANSDT